MVAARFRVRKSRGKKRAGALGELGVPFWGYL